MIYVHIIYIYDYICVPVCISKTCLNQEQQNMNLQTLPFADFLLVEESLLSFGSPGFDGPASWAPLPQHLRRCCTCQPESLVPGLIHVT